MKTILLRNWLSVMLSFVSAFSPVTSTKEVIPQLQPVAVVTATHSVKVVAHLPKSIQTKPAVQPVAKTATLNASAHTYTYVFAGQATCEGQPCSNASIEIQVTSEYGSNVHRATTGADGRYQVAVPVIGEPTQTLSWEIHALTSDFKKADLEGHQIFTDENSIQLNAPLTLIES